MGAHLGGDKVIRFWALGRAAFKSKMAAEIFHCSYLGDCLSYRLDIWYRCSLLYHKDIISKFWIPGALSSIPRWLPKYFILPYLRDCLRYRRQIWHRCSLYYKGKIDTVLDPRDAVFNFKMATKIFHCPYLRLF